MTTSKQGNGATKTRGAKSSGTKASTSKARNVGGKAGRKSVGGAAAPARADAYQLVGFEAVEALRAHTGLERGAMAAFLGVSDKTYKRRSQEGELSPGESLKTEMLQLTLEEARRVFRDEGKAQRWLNTRVVSLGNRRPIDHLDSVQGYERVKETLTKIEYGMY